MFAVRIQMQDFDVSTEIAALHSNSAQVGAVCSFVGVVRGKGAHQQPEGKSTIALEIEHYAGMTEKAIQAMVTQAQKRFGITAATVVHRIGRLGLGEQIVLVAVAAPHRHASFQACEFVMDYLKTQAPFWKKEYFADDPMQGQWVDARESDDAALQRWGLVSQNC